MQTLSMVRACLSRLALSNSSLLIYYSISPPSCSCSFRARLNYKKRLDSSLAQLDVSLSRLRYMKSDVQVSTSTYCLHIPHRMILSTFIRRSPFSTSWLSHVLPDPLTRGYQTCGDFPHNTSEIEWIVICSSNSGQSGAAKHVTIMHKDLSMHMPCTIVGPWGTFYNLRHEFRED